MSSVFFKFKSQKDPQRVTFDGTGISVFELKREIITISRLGDGTDFDLTIYNQDTNEEYDDDTVIIPRSTSIIARRLPASKPGQGRAARYVSGRMPVSAKNGYRKEQGNAPVNVPGKATTSVSKTASAMQNAKTEEERIKAMFEMGGAQWEQQQQLMSNATRVAFSGPKNKNISVPDHPPPTGYVCYRCGQKGHWIQVCPTNDNPDFENKPRIKRITGIPKSFLKTVDEPVAAKQDGLTDESRQPTSIMVNAEGDRVVAVPDQAAWQKYQEKALASAANQNVAAQGSKELQQRGLECSIDKRMFVDPMKTPCCGTTYCNECIENALINSDLVCPHCSTEGVLLDNLIPDDEMTAKIQAFEDEKRAEKKEKEQAPTQVEETKAENTTTKPSTAEAELTAQSNSQASSPRANGSASPVPSTKRKRSTDDDTQTMRIPDGPKAMRREGSANSEPKGEVQEPPKPMPPSSSDAAFIQQMNALAGIPNNTTPFNPMSMPPMMGMPNPIMMNPMMMGGMMGPNGWQNNMPVNGIPPFNGNMGMYGNGNMNQNWPQQPRNMANGWNGNANMAGGFQQGQGPNRFQNRQFNQVQNNEDAYMRKPVNPHRHQGRQKRVRPTDFKTLNG